MELEIAHGQMVRQQVRASEVLDTQILDVFTEIARHEFVPERYRELAYADSRIPLPHGECMMMPSEEGHLLQALDIKPTDRILEVGTGSGYLTACLGKLGAEVTSVDIHDDFIGPARELLADSGVNNATVLCMDAMQQLPDGEFDVIAVTGSLPIYDDRFARSLGIGGRLFIITGTGPAMDARIVTRVTADEFSFVSVFETDIPPLHNAPLPEPFRF